MVEYPPETYAPIFRADDYSVKDQWHLAPFFTNLDKSVYASLIFAPELIGALCSRASRAAGDLRTTYLREYLTPFLTPVRESGASEEIWRERVRYGGNLG